MDFVLLPADHFTFATGIFLGYPAGFAKRNRSRFFIGMRDRRRIWKLGRFMGAVSEG